MKPKKANPANANESQGIDRCQTPAYALDPLLPYLPKTWTVWEPAAGEGYLANAIAHHCSVVISDILDGRNFFHTTPECHYDALITNPPYSIKPQWIRRCYELGKPFALLMPVETIGTEGAAEQFERWGIQVIWLRPRINFKMPNKGLDGQAQFPTAWFTYGFNLPRNMMFYKLKWRAEGQLALF